MLLAERAKIVNDRLSGKNLERTWSNPTLLRRWRSELVFAIGLNDVRTALCAIGTGALRRGLQKRRARGRWLRCARLQAVSLTLLALAFDS